MSSINTRNSNLLKTICISVNCNSDVLVISVKSSWFIVLWWCCWFGLTSNCQFILCIPTIYIALSETENHCLWSWVYLLGIHTFDQLWSHDMTTSTLLYAKSQTTYMFIIWLDWLYSPVFENDSANPANQCDQSSNTQMWSKTEYNQLKKLGINIGLSCWFFFASLHLVSLWFSYFRENDVVRNVKLLLVKSSESR